MGVFEQMVGIEPTPEPTNQTIIDGLEKGIQAMLELQSLRDAATAFITQAEACNFTDRHGHALEMNVAYRALKESVSG